MCINEDQVAQMFIDQGFKEVFCENLTMKKRLVCLGMQSMLQVQLVVECVMSLFSPPDTKVFSINSPTFFDVNFRFGYSMEHTDLTHFEHTEFTDQERRVY